MRSRTFLLGVTAAHGSLEPIVLVRNQEEEHNRRLRQPKPRKRRHALVAQWIERPSPERKATSPILVEGTHETPPTIMHGALLLFSLKPSRLVRLVHHEATPL